MKNFHWLLQKSDFLFILVLEGQVYYGEPNEMRSLPISELQGNYKTTEKRILLLCFNVALFTEVACLIPRSC